jgi:hypothetical protein
MKKIKQLILIITLVFFTACGTETQVNTSKPFDLWNYMTSAGNYEVEYAIYENNQFTDYYTEEHFQYGNEYVRSSTDGETKILLNSNRMLMVEPNNQINIIRYVNIGDSGIFQASNIRLCSFERFYEIYRTKGQSFDNVVQVSCTYNSGVYQELYYGFNEGIVSIYEEDNGLKTEYIKTNEQRI